MLFCPGFGEPPVSVLNSSALLTILLAGAGKTFITYYLT
jgi:hypothetical protein